MIHDWITRRIDLRDNATTLYEFKKLYPSLPPGDNSMGILEQLRMNDATRVKRWHGKRGIKDWNTMEWACAMCGEAGEAANMAKKIGRFDHKLNRRKNEKNRIRLVRLLADEIADTIIYLDLLALREGIDLPSAIKSKFNRTSKEFGFPERL